MKNFLLGLSVLLSSLSFGQNVLIKDSAVSSANGGPFGSATVTDYTYNTKCLPIIEQSPTQLVTNYYDDNNRLSVFTSQFNFNTGSYVNAGRVTYTYNAAGKITVNTIEQWNSSTSMYENASRNLEDYDANNYLIKLTQQLWDVPSNTWMTFNELYYYNNNNGRVDSTYNIYVNSPGDTITNKSYDTYFTDSIASSQILSYQYVSGSLLLATRITVFQDSSNYITHDSTFYETALPASSPFVPSSSFAVTRTYNTDHTVKELRSTNRTFITNSSSTSVHYYIYGPCSSALPVIFTMFSASRQNNNALLQWQTANETNVSSFQVQRSTDGIHFTAVGSVKALGNGSPQSYTFTDVNALLMNAPKLYYRLAEQDATGAISYSKTATLDVAAGKWLVYVSPNPVASRINIYAPATLNAAQITIRDMQGSVVYSGKQTITAGNKITIDASGFAKGMYIVTLQSASTQQQVKIIKE